MDERYKKIKEQRVQLPIYGAREKLLFHFRQMNTVILIGETGSGKTTQVPQYLFEAGLHRDGIIAVTQPRRVAAITLSQRVAEERRSPLGHLVGYCIRFEDMTDYRTKIKYMTDGMLLREAILDPLLKKYSIVILDEAHERTIHTDVLFGVVKMAQKRRLVIKGLRPLKVVLMSATMDVDHFANYFTNSHVLYIEGRLYPVKIFYTPDHQSDYVFSSLVTIFQIHKQAPPEEDILVFLTGQEEIESTVKQIKDIVRDMERSIPPLVVYPLYAALPPHLQLRAFKQTPKGARKVILATNIAETSLTICGIKYVVDSGRVKAKVCNPINGLDLLKIVRISKAQAMQRSGRAGRETMGSCYRLYTEQEFDLFQKNTVPEILRCNLAGVYLQLLAMGIPDIVNFDFMDKPSDEHVVSALDQLVLLDAIEKQEKIQLTNLGRKMAAFPLDPRLSKGVIMAKDFGCLEEILSIVSILSVESIIFTPQNKREEAVAARKKFISVDGDLITYLNILKAYKRANKNKNWCCENFVNAKNIQMALDVKDQLKKICENQQLPIVSCGQDTTMIRKCLALGYFMNAAELQKGGDYITLSSRKVCSIHPSSALFQSRPAYVIYNELIQTTKCYMRDVCVMDLDWLVNAAPDYFKTIK